MSGGSCRITQVNKSLLSSWLHKGKREQSFPRGVSDSEKPLTHPRAAKEKQASGARSLKCILSAIKVFQYIKRTKRHGGAECLMFIDCVSCRPRETMNFLEGGIIRGRVRTRRRDTARAGTIQPRIPPSRTFP